MKKWFLIIILFLFHEIILFVPKIFWIFYANITEINIKFSNFIFFDIASFNITFLPLIIIVLIVPELLKGKILSKIIIFIFFFIPAYLLIFMNFADVFYFQQNKKRISYEVFTMHNELLEALPGIFQEYKLYITTSFIFILILSYVFYKITKRLLDDVYSKKWYLRLLNFIVFLLISIFLVRGGFRYKPITVAKAYENVPVFWGNWHLNTFYYLANYLLSDKIKPVNLISSEIAIKITREHSFSPRIDSLFVSSEYPVMKITKSRTEKRYNIVLFIIESLGKEYLTSDYTPFLYKLKEKSIEFKDYYSPAVRSIEAVPALFLGIPSIFDFSLIGTQYSLIKNKNIIRILNEKGYHTSFFHGAHRGSMGFLSYTKALGFQKYYGMEDMPNYKKYYDGNWGIYDHYFINFFVEKIKTFKKPFFTTFFTLSNHQPYNLPPEFGKENNFINTLKYTDYSIKLFFDKVKNEKWFENTIFIFTADHYFNFEKKDVPYPHLHEVPFFIYIPGGNKKVYINTTSHINFTSTLIDLLNLNVKYSSFAPSGLDTLAKHYTIFNHDNAIMLIKGNVGISYSKITEEVVYLIRKQGKWNIANEIYPDLKKELFSLYQTINNLVLEDRYYND